MTVWWQGWYIVQDVITTFLLSRIQGILWPKKSVEAVSMRLLLYIHMHTYILQKSSSDFNTDLTASLLPMINSFEFPQLFHTTRPVTTSLPGLVGFFNISPFTWLDPGLFLKTNREKKRGPSATKQERKSATIKLATTLNFQFFNSLLLSLGFESQSSTERSEPRSNN
jgi:hypothetical protein